MKDYATSGFAHITDLDFLSIKVYGKTTRNVIYSGNSQLNQPQSDVIFRNWNLHKACCILFSLEWTLNLRSFKMRDLSQFSGMRCWDIWRSQYYSSIWSLTKLLLLLLLTWMLRYICVRLLFWSNVENLSWKRLIKSTPDWQTALRSQN